MGNRSSVARRRVIGASFRNNRVGNKHCLVTVATLERFSTQSLATLEIEEFSLRDSSSDRFLRLHVFHWPSELDPDCFLSFSSAPWVALIRSFAFLALLLFRLTFAIFEAILYCRGKRSGLSFDKWCQCWLPREETTLMHCEGEFPMFKCADFPKFSQTECWLETNFS